MVFSQKTDINQQAQAYLWIKKETSSNIDMKTSVRESG
jgi:hypothetical protein